MFAVIGVILVVCVSVWGFVLGAVQILYLEPACLKHGYKETNITWDAKLYCIKREDQTDKVVRLNELEK
jgi:hypothetical protein